MGDVVLQTPGENIRPTTLDEDTVRELVSRLYGLQVTSYKEFISYDDRNYYVTVDDVCTNENIGTASGDGYVLKVLNTKDSKKLDYVEAMNALLKHLHDGNIPISNPQANKDGAFYSLETITHGACTEECVVRLFDFIPGKVLLLVPYEPRLLYNIGKLVAGVDKRLMTFSHPFYETHDTIWCLSSVPQLSKHLDVVKDEDDRRMVAEIIDAFTKDVVSAYGKIRRGLIHGDANEQNILVTRTNDHYDVTGIIDAGDATKSYLIFEVAILIAYVMIDSKVIDSFEAGGHVLAGYISVLDLTPTERDVLRVCVAARLTQSLVMGLNAYSAMPGNDYVLTTSARGWPCLRRLWACSKDELYSRWERVIEEYANNP